MFESCRARVRHRANARLFEKGISHMFTNTTLAVRLPKGAGGATIQVNTDTLPVEIQKLLMQHGLQQKMSDPAAGMAKAGKDQAEIETACLSVLERLRAGTWAEKATGPRATNLEEFINQEAKKKALSRVVAAEEGKDAQVAAIIAKVGREQALKAIWDRYAETDSFRKATQLLWEARTAKADVDLMGLDI